MCLKQSGVLMSSESYEQFMKRMEAAGTLGSCEFFDVKPFIDAANILVASDEPLRALQLLNNLPGYYRDNIPTEVKELKDAILKGLATPTFYQHSMDDVKYFSPEYAKHILTEALRGIKIHDDIKEYNAKGIVPHLVDMGPGEYWLPVGLMGHNALFTYSDIGLCEKARLKAKTFLDSYWLPEPPKDRPHIFVACEIIEHLHHEQDILTEYLRHGVNADIIHMSTPMFSFDGRQSQLDWKKNIIDLGHLRTYTPKEFMDTVIKMFPGYKWDFWLSNVMHIRGAK